MAKQTFSVGQTLTAAQMTSLQQTAMLGGAASAKTASYTLVAADAGGAISMNSASATTITVNTALFAAGDTVQITNLGAGVCTITAGTATVNTSASLALAQYESGTLDFTSTSAAIFIKGAGAAASAGGMTLLSTTTISGTSTTVSSISQSYKNLFVEVFGCTWDSSNDAWTFRTNLGAVNSSKKINANSVNSPQNSVTTINQINDGTDNIKRTGGNNYVTYNFTNYASTSTYKTCAIYGSFEDSLGNAGPIILFVSINSNTAINEFQFAIAGSQNMTAGTIKIYGVN